MATSESARLVSTLEMQDKGFSSTANKANRSLTGLERNSGKATSGLGKLGKAAGGVRGNLLGLAKSGVGLLGLTVGVAGLAKGIQDAVGAAEDFGNASTKFAKLTGQSVESASAMVDTLDKFGISGDAAVSTFARLQKNAGALVNTTKKAAKFQKDYGLSLTGNNGKLVDSNELLMRSADFFNSNATATQKATVLSKLYGKTWTQLIPLLSKGSAGIRKEEQSAMHLTRQQVKDLASLRGAQRELNDTWGDTQVMIGLALVPQLTKLARALNTFLSTNQKGITEFFSGLAKFAEDAGNAIGTFIVPAIKAIAGAWASIPPEVKQLLVAGVVANKGIKLVTGFSPFGLAQDIFKSVLGIKAGVVNVQGAVVNGGGVGGIGGKGGPNLLGLLTAALGGAVIGQIIGHAIIDPKLAAQQTQMSADMKRQLATGNMADISTGLRAIRTGIKDIEALPGAAQEFGGQLDFLRKAEADYVAWIKKNTLTPTTHPGDPKLKAAEDRAHAADRRKRDLSTLTPRDLKRATKDGVTEGNRDAAKRRDLQSLDTNVRLGLRQARTDITRVEAAGLREVRGGLSVLQGALVAVLGGGFGAVVAAVNGISLPAFIDTGFNATDAPRRKNSKTGKGDILTVSGKGEGQNRGGSVANIQTNVSHRQNNGAGQVSDRYTRQPQRGP